MAAKSMQSRNRITGFLERVVSSHQAIEPLPGGCHGLKISSFNGLKNKREINGEGA